MKEEDNVSRVGWFFVVVQVILLILKLLNVLKCSWFWVLTPVWVLIGLYVLAVVVAILALFIGE